MYRIIDERGSGKTSRLMLLAKEDGSAIVCSNPRAMEIKANAYGITGINFISYCDFINKQNHDFSNYYIDELEDFLYYFHHYNGFSGQMKGYSLSLEDEE